jgi:hypothetical protein
MKKVAPIILLVLAMPVSSSAHRLDEYLQAARLSLARDGLTLEVDMTPGVNVAQTIAALIDRNGDGAMSQSEAGAYGATVLKELVLELNGRAVPLTLTRVEIPSRDELNDGLGTIRLHATGGAHVIAGRHQLHFRNNHQPTGSVYLANALLPDEAGVVVLSQARDPRQQSIRIEYEVQSQWTKVLWLVVGGTLVASGFSRKLRSSA